MGSLFARAVRHRICSVRTYRLRLRSDRPYLGDAPAGAQNDEYFVRPPWRSLYSHHFETLLVRVEVDSGAVGWGEALAPVGPEVPQAIIDRLLGPQMIGADALAPRPLMAQLGGLMRERGHLVGHQADALAACDIALWDLAGRVSGVPVAQLLGGAFRRVIPTYISGLPRPTDAERSELARDWERRGALRLKLALGHGIEQDLHTFDAVATACPGLPIAVDAHWSYSYSEAERLGQHLDERGAWFLEAPLVPEDIDGHRRLASRIITPVAIGETLRNRYEFAQWLSRHAVDLCQPDVARTGITEAQAIAGLAQVHHVRVAPHHSVGLGVALAAGLHFAAAIENLDVFEFQPSTFPIANRILVCGLEADAASVSLPDGPGLGVTVNESLVTELSGDTA
jgi:D-galactarolactone cycloisomerase